MTAGGPKALAVTKSAVHASFSDLAAFSASSQTILTLSEALSRVTASRKKFALLFFSLYEYKFPVFKFLYQN